ncbi:MULTISPECIES: hypothetical protein [unclassified Archaeoglobus]|uniref:hypothetical protein n=1 Tax=unclassified Archaeoglobus TaxID=2643606 RepID=UPI0025BDD925|nr:MULTISPECIES: hypothetical protein [unclassified Archaeoglobus]
MRVVRIMLFAFIISFVAAVNVVEAKTYVENFYQVGGVDVTTASPFPKAWTRTWDSGETNNDFDPPSGTPSTYQATPYSQADIDAVEALDGSYSSVSVTSTDSGLFGPSDEDYATHLFMFSVVNNQNATIELHAYVSAVQGYNGNSYIYLWDGSTFVYQTQIGVGWNNISISPSYVSSNGELYVLFITQAYATSSWGSVSFTAYIRIDYIEVVAVVPDTAVQTACAQFISGAPRDWDGIFDDDTLTFVGRVTDTSGSPIPNYPIVSGGVWTGGYGIMATGYTNSTGYATLTGRPIDGGITDKWRVNFAVAILGDVMVNGNAYQIGSSCYIDYGAYNVAVTPGSYDIMLVGRYWDNGGGDWVRIRWIAEAGDVSHVNLGGYNIPVAQRFDDWDFLLWKIGVPDPNNDNDGEIEGVNGNTNDMNSAAYPACVGPDTSPYCPGMDSCRNGRSINVLLIGYIGSYPPGCCIRERSGSVDAHDCGTYMSGYRFGPLLEFNLPDHALGEPGKSAMFICQEYNTLSGMLRTTSYSGHEGCGGGNCRISCTACLWSIINIGQSPGATEYLAMSGYTYLGTTIIRPWPNGGLGTLSFIGLAADNQHVVGLVVGHRWGVHPFLALVTSMPSGTYPADTDTAGWQNFYPTWIYYLLRNVAYNIKVMGEELWHWSDRYPPSGEDNIILANRAFNTLLLDFLPYLDETLWILQASGNNTIHPFIVTTFTQLYDNARIVKYIVTNSTLRSEFANTIGTALTYLPNITGTVDGSTGLNYFLKYRVQMPYNEKESVNYQLMKLLNQLTSFVITILHHIPIMEYAPNSPGWNFGNWISDY